VHLEKHVGKGTPYVPSPILTGIRLLFTAGNSEVLSGVDASTGNALFDPKRLSGVGSLYSSPVAANGHLYVTGRDGNTLVLKDNESLEVVATNQLNDAIDASLVAVGNQLFLRSWAKLYCIEQAK